MSYDEKLQICYIRWLNAVTALAMFGLSRLITGGGVAQTVWGVRSSESIVAMAAHGFALSVALLALVGWVGLLAGERDDFHIAEVAHKGLYYLHIALVVVISIAAATAICRGLEVWGYLWMGVVAGMALLLWGASYRLINGLRRDLDELTTY